MVDSGVQKYLGVGHYTKIFFNSHCHSFDKYSFNYNYENNTGHDRISHFSKDNIVLSLWRSALKFMKRSCIRLLTQLLIRTSCIQPLRTYKNKCRTQSAW